MITSELYRLLHVHGPFGLLVHSTKKVWRRLFQNRSHVFSFVIPGNAPASHSNLKITRYTTIADIPTSITSQLTKSFGEEYLRITDRELSLCAHLYVVTAGQELVAVQRSRLGRHVQRWYVKLDSDDLVIFGGKTVPAYRGRGVMPWLIQHQAVQHGKPGGTAWADCKVWNTPARHAIENAGFRYFGTFPSLKTRIL